MDELEEALSRHEILQQQEVVNDDLLYPLVTLREWQVFFLSDESTLSCPRKNISSGVAVVVTS
jgi:hypothetical protein